MENYDVYYIIELTIIIFLLVIAWVIEGLTVFFLNVESINAKWSPPALVERTLLANTRFVSISIVMLLVGNLLFGWGMSPHLRLFVLAVALLIGTPVSLYWLYIYKLKGRRLFGRWLVR